MSHTSFENVLSCLVEGYRLPPPETQFDLLGYNKPGASLLLVSIRAPHTVYQTVGFIAYICLRQAACFVCIQTHSAFLNSLVGGFKVGQFL